MADKAEEIAREVLSLGMTASLADVATLLRPHLEPDAAQSWGTVSEGGSRQRLPSHTDKVSKYSPSGTLPPYFEEQSLYPAASNPDPISKYRQAIPYGADHNSTASESPEPYCNHEESCDCGERSAPSEPRIEQLASEIAFDIIGHQTTQAELKQLLIEFAKEVRRAAIEPTGF